MKARLAKKISTTPVDRLAPRWLNAFIRHGISDPTIATALRKYSELKNKSQNENWKTSQEPLG